MSTLEHLRDLGSVLPSEATFGVRYRAQIREPSRSAPKGDLNRTGLTEAPRITSNAPNGCGGLNRAVVQAILDVPGIRSWSVLCHNAVERGKGTMRL